MDDKTRNSLTGSLQLLLAALIWGTAFVAQSVGMDHVGPFTFNAVRNLIGALFLVPFILILNRVRRRGEQKAADAAERKQALTGGLVCGLFLCIAGNLQQFGIRETTVGKAGFITALYIVMVPLLGVFIGKKVRLNLWISVALSLIGMYLLCITEKLTIGRGDIFVLGSALGFAFQILSVDHYAARIDGILLACLEYFFCSIFTFVLMFAFETPRMADILAAAGPILYTGIFSCGIAYTLQILGQSRVDPTLASLIMSLEAVISALSGWLILGQKLSPRELIGAVIMFAAVILAQFPLERKNAGKGE